MLKKKKTTASGKLVLVKSVRRTRSHRMKFCVQRGGLGALPSTSKRRGKSQRDFLLCGPVCINTGIAVAVSKNKNNFLITTFLPTIQNGGAGGRQEKTESL